VVQLTTCTQLANELKAVEKGGGAHVWIDSASRMIVGDFPQAIMFFDFTREAFMPLPNESGPAAMEKKQAGKKRVSLLNLAPRVTQIFEIETDVAIHEVGSATEALVRGLDIIEDKRPGTHLELAKEKKRTKRMVAQEREQLYDHPHPPEHSRKLKSGFWVATNNKADEAISYLKKAADMAGMTESFSVRRKPTE